MFVKRKDYTVPTSPRALDKNELEQVSGGWVEVVKGSDGAPGCVVVHPGVLRLD